MNSENKVPEIRFKGFDGEWKEVFLGNKATIINGRAYSQEELQDKGKYPVLRVGNFYTNASWYYSDMELGEKYYANSGDLLYTWSASFGPHIWSGKKVIYHYHIWKLQLSNDMDKLFLLQLLDYDKDKILSGSSGSTMIHITKSGMESKIVIIPEEKEQSAIGNYFQKLDRLINQHQQKHDKLSNLKKAMLEKMFPKPGKTTPEIRFKGFSGEWAESGFENCFTHIPNNTLSRADLNYEQGVAKNIHYGDVLIKFGELLDASNEVLPFVTNEKMISKAQHAALVDGDIIIADAAEDTTVGKCTELINIAGQLVFSGLHTIAIRPILPFASKYLGYYLNSGAYHNQLLPLMQGTKVLSLSKSALKNTSLKFPKSLEEQTAIGNYFQKLDQLINQHQEQISKLNNIKQACLSKMFV